MGLVLVTVTLVIALAHQSVARRLRRILPYVNRASGLLLVAAGSYVAYYGYWDLRLNAGDQVALGPVGLVTGVSARVEGWVEMLGPGRLGLGTLLLIGGVAAVGWRRSRQASETPDHSASAEGINPVN